MPTTPNRGYPTPAGTVPPNGPLAFQEFGNAVDADVHDVWQLLNDVAARTPYKQASGRAAVAIPYNTTNATTVVNLPPGFTVPPNITVTINNAPGGNSSKIIAKAVSIAADKFTMAMYVSDNTTLGTTWSMTASWHAVQMTPTDADG